MRLIAATNRNLEEAVAKGEYRADLYYRINVVTMFLPPLRERREDIPLLVEYFVDKYNKENDRRLALSPEAMHVLINCNWPGNVRELENCVERMATMSRSNLIRDVDLPCQQGKCFSLAIQNYGKTGKIVPVPIVAELMHNATDEESEELPSEPVTASGMPAFGSERDRYIWAMEQCGWVQAKAARLLSITPRQMGYALQKYNIPLKRL